MTAEMASLLWLRSNDPEMTHAEFIVRCARRMRWSMARFAGPDVERAARAIERDPHYRADVAADALRHAEQAGKGRTELLAALDALRASDRRYAQEHRA